MEQHAQIMVILDDLLRQEDVYACMFIRKGMQGVVPSTDKFKKEVINIWSVLQQTMDEFFDIIAQYSNYNLGEVQFSLMEYEVIFFILPWSDTALVVICPILANKGLLEIEMENGRRKILDILGKDDEH